MKGGIIKYLSIDWRVPKQGVGSIYRSIFGQGGHGEGSPGHPRLAHSRGQRDWGNLIFVVLRWPFQFPIDNRSFVPFYLSFGAPPKHYCVTALLLCPCVLTNFTNSLFKLTHKGGELPKITRKGSKYSIKRMEKNNLA